MAEERKNSSKSRLGNLLTSLRYNPFVPLSKRDEERVLERYRTAVDKYLPLIEERTGVDLGEVPVVSMRKGIRESVKKVAKEIFEPKDSGRNWPYLFANALTFIPIELKRMWLEELVSACYDSSSKKFLVPFGLKTKSRLVNGSFYGGQITDEIVLHELTHRLWDQIPEKTEFGKTPEIWVEGFATYGHLNWFSDLLPTGKPEYVKGYGNLHTLGARLINSVVQRHSEEILLEIPRRWPEFDREFGLGNA